MSAATYLKLIPGSGAPAPKPRKFKLWEAFRRGLDQVVERPASEARRPVEGRPMIFRVTYEVAWGAEADDYTMGNAAKTETVLAMDVIEAIEKVRLSLERECAAWQARRAKYLQSFSKRGKKPSREEWFENDASELIHFRPFHVEIVGEIDHV